MGRVKVEKKVKEHARKLKREKKKNPGKFQKSKKDQGVPNECPFKDKVLAEAQEAMEKRNEDLEKRRKEMKEMRKAGKTRKLAELRGQTLEGLVASAKQRGSIHDATSGVMGAVADRGVTDTSAKAYYREFKKVVDAADVVLEVLDARDPLGSRCKEVEQGVVVGGGKRLVLVLNKADLVPRENLQAWVKYLRNEYPTIAFKASTQNTARLFLAGSLGHTAQLGLRKSRRKSLASSRRLDITQLLFHSSPSPGGMETTCCRPVRIWTGTRVGLSSARKERP